MKDKNAKILYKEKEYTIYFNLNVMEAIQEEYGSVSEWADMVYGGTEPKIKPLIFAFCLMINEGIAIDNEDNGKDEPMITHRIAGRIASEIGYKETSEKIGELVKESADDGTKNA